MKRKLLSLLLTLSMLLPCLPAASAAEEKPDFAGDDGIIKVLAIGNSFTKDSFYFFDDVEGAQDHDDEIKMVVGYLYQGGVPVQTHADNAVNDKEAYIYYKYDRTVSKSFTEVKSTTRTALLDEDWDLISIQQTPILSSDNGKEGGLETLVDFIRTHATNPKMKLGRHFTWAYGGVYQYTGPYKDQFINTYHSSSDAMYQDIVRFAQEFEQTHPEFEFMVPAGTVIENLRAGAFGDSLQRDSYHLNSFGRGMIAYTWYTFLTGKPLDSIKLSKTYWTPTQYERSAIMEAINGALANPYQVTPATGSETAPRRVYYTLEPLVKEGGEVKAYDVSDPTQIVTVQYSGHTGTTTRANMFYILQDDGKFRVQTLFNWVPNVGYHNYYQGYDASNTVILANGTATLGGHVGSKSCGFVCTPDTSSGGRELPFYILNTPTTTPVVDVTGEDHGLKTLQDIIDLSATHRIRINHYSQYNSAPDALFVDEVTPLAVSKYTLQEGDVVYIPGTAAVGTSCEAYVMNSATAQRAEKVSVTIPDNTANANGDRNSTIGRFWEMKDGQLKIVNGMWYSQKDQGDPALTPYRYGYHDEVANYTTGVLTLARHPKHLGYGKDCQWNFAQPCGSADSRGLLCSADLKRTSADLKIIDLRADVLAGKVAPLTNIGDVHTQCKKHDDIMVNTFVPDGTKETGTAAVLIVLDSSGFFTRGEVVQALYEKAGRPEVTPKVTFTDVSVDNVHYNATSWAANKKYISGYGDGTFGPDDHVTMEQLAVILWKYMGRPEDDVSLSQLGRFSPWATNALHWAVAKNVFETIPYTTLGDSAPRTETVQMLANYLK